MISISPPPNDSRYDIIIVSGEYWADHPHSGVGVIARILSDQGYSVGIVEKPDWTDTADIKRFGMPNLFYGVTSGAIDSMLQNYTPLKKLRKKDRYNPYDSKIPDRAVIVYSQKILQTQNQLITENQNLEKKPIVLGGVEASLRRFTHYDYWDNDVRKPILLDSKADILVYGPGEHQIIQIAQRIEKGEDFYNIPIPGTCVLVNENPNKIKRKTKSNGKISEEFQEKDAIYYEMLPSFEKVVEHDEKFCKMHMMFSNKRNLAQKVKNRYVIQNKQHNYTSEELDALYNLPFSYNIPDKHKELKMAQFSIITHRGCFGNCNFCSIALHQGDKIISRSKKNILDEIEKMKEHPDFKGYINDLGGPSANMYGMDCEASDTCDKDCLECKNRITGHEESIHLLKKARNIDGIKKIFVRSGIRYDLVVEGNEKYLKELLLHHLSGYLKIAPEHFSPKICELMNKPADYFKKFLSLFKKLNKEKNWKLKYYFITAHPGSSMKEARELSRKLRKLGRKNTNKVQVFTPTPISKSTCMYHTGLNPFNLKQIYVPYSYREKKRQKRIFF